MRLSRNLLFLTAVVGSAFVAGIAVPSPDTDDYPAIDETTDVPRLIGNHLQREANHLDKRQGFRSYQPPGPGGSDGTGFGIGGGQGYKQQAHEEQGGGEEGQEAAGNAVPEQAQEQQESAQGQVQATGTMSGETVVEIATQDIETISHLIVASATLPAGATTTPARSPADPTSFGPAVPLRVSTYVDPNASATSSSGTAIGTVTNAGAGLGGPATSSSAANAAKAFMGMGLAQGAVRVGWMVGAAGVLLGGGLAGLGMGY